MTKSSEEKRIQIENPHAEINIPNSEPFAHARDPFTGEVSIKRADEILLSDDWDKIPEISKTRGVKVEKPEDLVFLVELPLYKACRLLYEAKIITTESNAHFDEGQDEAHIILTIVWNSLNDSQQNAAKELCLNESDKWKRVSSGDYEVLNLNWKIKKSEVNPRQVKQYVEQEVKKLINGRIKFKT